MALHGLYVPTKAAWYSAFQEELLRFPAGKHDDMVDALGLIGQMLDVIMPGLPPTKNPANSMPPKDYVEIADHRMLERVMFDSEFHLHSDADDYRLNSILTL